MVRKSLLPGLAALVLLLGPGLSSAIAADLAAGKQKARQACQVCHGLDGLAKNPIAPHIAGESEIYIQKQLKAFRSGKRQDEIMNVIAEPLTDQEITDLAAWYAAIEISVTMPDLPE